MAIKFNILSAGGKGKGLNIFKSDAYKEHEKAPMAQAFWRMRWAVGIWMVCALAFAIAFIVEHIWRYGWGPATARWTTLYLQNMMTTGGLSVLAEIPAWFSRVFWRTDIMCIAPLIPFVAYYFMADSTLVKEFNPHGKDKFDEKSSNKATAADIKKMGGFKNPEGLFKGFMMVLGYFKNKDKEVPLMFDECFSALVLAPAGTGKTIGVVLPTILDCDTVSMIINDPKPELMQLTSGYRATIGPTFIINWGAREYPEQGVYYPSWNPLSPENLPADAEARNTYIQIIVNTLIEEAKGSADPHWPQAGRAGLTGFINFIVSKVERAKADDYFYARLSDGKFDAEDAAVLMDYYMTMSSDPNAYAAMALLQRGELNTTNYVHVGTWAGLTPEWHGREASIPMFLAWYTSGQLMVAQQIEQRKRQGDQMVMWSDPMKDFLNAAVEEAQLYAYDTDAISALINLANTPDKERGSIMSTINTGLNIFRHPGVNNHTRHSDLHFSDIRGMVDPRDGKMKPVSVFLSINLSDAAAMNPITSMFIELMSNYLISNPPGTTNNGVKLGPCPTLFVLDEMPTMNKLDAIIRGPAVGRGQQVSYLIVGQDISQIAEKYGDKAADTIIANTAAKVILRVNDPATAERFSKMMGKKMKKKTVKGPDGKDTETTEEEDLFTPMQLMTLPKGKQLVLIQGNYNRPIEATGAEWFKNKSAVEKKLYAKIQTGQASPLPEFLIPSHHAAMGYAGEPRVLDPNTHQIKVLKS